MSDWANRATLATRSTGKRNDDGGRKCRFYGTRTDGRMDGMQKYGKIFLNNVT